MGDDIEFLCKLSEDNEVLIWHNKVMSGYGKQYGTLRWFYQPYGKVLGEGGAW